MPAGPGYLSPNGVWLYGEDDTEANVSDLLNLLGESVDTALAGIKTPPTKILATSPGVYPTAAQTVTFAEPITAQRNGIILIWSYYTSAGGVSNSNYVHTVIHKHQIALAGTGVSIALPVFTSKTTFYKYLYITNTELTGHADNGAIGGVGMVLRAVVAF